MTTYRIADRRRWTSVSNEAIEDASLSFRARGLLVWLLSKPDGWQVKSEVIAASGAEGRDAIRATLTELEEAGYIRRERTQDGQGRWVNSCSIFESPKTDFQAPVSPSPVSQASSTKDSEVITDEQPELRSGELIAETRVDTRGARSPADLIAQEYWDWHVADSGKMPTTKYVALRSITKALLKAGYEHDEIVDAMKATKVMNAKSVADVAGEAKHKREETPSTRAIPGGIVRAFAKCEPWFERRGLMRQASEREYWMRLCATQVSLGYGPGEIMLRMAVALRANNASTFALSDAKVERFNGEIADYPDAMERAYTNRAWSAK